MTKKHWQISKSQKIVLWQYSRDNSHLKQGELSQWFKKTFDEDVTQGQISQFLSKAYDHLDNDDIPRWHDSKQRCIQRWPELESALYQWHQQMEDKIPITEDLIRATADRLFRRISIYQGQELPKWSNGWLNNFKKKHGIKQHTQHGESDNVDQAAIIKKIVS